MLIGICGGICAGKNAIQNYLIQQHGFSPLAITRATEVATNSFSLEAEPDLSTVRFPDVQQLLKYVTDNWQKHFVTTSIHDESVVAALSGRPFFILVHVDAPISIRWHRFQTRCEAASLTPPSLEQFVLSNDAHLYSTSTNLAKLASRAQIIFLNSSNSLIELHRQLDLLNLPDPSRLRPTWDHYFMTLASLAARRSNCMRRSVGCVLVREKRVMSTGYNGTPRHIANCNEGGCPRCNSGSSGGTGLSMCLCIHAEENALLEAGRERIGGGAVLYCTTCPCLTCAIKIVQVGIAEVVYNRSYYMDAEAAEIFKQADVKLRQFSPPAEGLVYLGDTGVSLPLGLNASDHTGQLSQNINGKP